jgi:hypothetical protein
MDAALQVSLGNPHGCGTSGLFRQPLWMAHFRSVYATNMDAALQVCSGNPQGCGTSGLFRQPPHPVQSTLSEWAKGDGILPSVEPSPRPYLEHMMSGLPKEMESTLQ